MTAYAVSTARSLSVQGRSVHAPSNHARPHGIDRLVMRLSVAMLRWARNHADRSLETWDQGRLRAENARAREAREQASAIGVLRIF